MSRARRWARPGVAARPPAHGVCASRGGGGTSDSRALPEYPSDPHAMQADTRGCGDAHTACCVHMWCLIARPLERDWVCVWRGAGGSGGGDGAGWHALRGRGKLRLIQCVPRTVRNGASLRRSSLDKVCRDNPPLQCSICSHELPMCVRVPMHVGVCGCACACARARTSSFIGSSGRRLQGCPTLECSVRSDEHRYLDDKDLAYNNNLF